MKKWQKIVLIITTITIIVGVMVVPSFAYYEDTDGHLEPDRLIVHTKMKFDGQTHRTELIDIPITDLTNYADCSYLFVDFWADGEQQYTKSLVCGFLWISRGYAVSIPDVGDVFVLIDSDSISIEYIPDSTYRWCNYTDFTFKLCAYPTFAETEEHYDSLTGYVKNVEDYCEELESINRDLYDDNIRLEFDMADLRSENENLQQINDDLSSDMAIIESEYQKLSREVEGLRNTNAIEAFVNGLAKGFNDFIDIISGFSVGGITLGAVITVAVVGIVILVLIKFMR